MTSTSSTTTSATSTSTTISTRFFSTDDGYEEGSDLLFFWDNPLKNNISEFDTLFFYTESWILSDTEFHLVGLIISLGDFYDIGEAEFSKYFRGTSK